MTQACCEPVLQSSTRQWGMHCAKSSAAVHCWWVTAHSYLRQVFIGEIAVTQACCELLLHSSTGQWGMHFAKNQCCSALLVGHCTLVSAAGLNRCNCSDTSMLQACFAEQHCTVWNVFCQNQCCSGLLVGHCTFVRAADPDRCRCSDKSML